MLLHPELNNTGKSTATQAGNTGLGKPSQAGRLPRPTTTHTEGSRQGLVTMSISITTNLVPLVKQRLNDDAGETYSDSASLVTNALIYEFRRIAMMRIRREFLAESCISSSALTQSSTPPIGSIPLPSGAATTPLRILWFTLTGGYQSDDVRNSDYPIYTNDVNKIPTLEHPALYFKDTTQGTNVCYVLPIGGTTTGASGHLVTLIYIPDPTGATIVSPALSEPLVCGAAAILALNQQEYEMGSSLRKRADELLAQLLEKEIK